MCNSNHGGSSGIPCASISSPHFIFYSSFPLHSSCIFFLPPKQSRTCTFFFCQTILFLSHIYLLVYFSKLPTLQEGNRERAWKWAAAQHLAVDLGKQYFMVELYYIILDYVLISGSWFWKKKKKKKRSISEDSLRRYVFYASENCIQELLSASDCNKAGSGNDGWKLLAIDNGVEISKRSSTSLHTFRSRWLLKSVSPQQFITVANAIDAAKVKQASLSTHVF